jgi:hypothetical protein
VERCFTNEAGVFTIVGLSVVEATLPGFQPYSRTSFVLESGSGPAIDITMTVGQLRDTPAPNPPLPSTPASPRVLCGLLVVPGNPGVDAGLTKLPDTGMTHPMQVVPPIVCR